MSCCPSVPPSAAIGGAFADANGPESDIRPGETVECYMARGGNTTGLQDDATENALNKIDNTSIPISRTKTSASTDTTFKLTVPPASANPADIKTAASWVMTPVPPGLSFTSNGQTAKLSGTFAPSAYGNVYQVQVTAKDSSNNTIDTRGFTVAPSKGGESDEIRLISPLPGAIVNSKFGPRMHPIHKVMKPHTGIDMKYQDRSVKDVLAAADGEVILCGGNPSTGYGLRVWIKHSTASGTHLCTTTYNHLAKIYVTQGQKVMAGQKVGLEGSTGGSTGNHLHFECRLPDGKFIDPVPLIQGQLSVANSTDINGDGSNVQQQNSSASLSIEEVRARQGSCAAFGPGYPQADPPESNDSVPSVPDTDPFERAWFFTMTHEVGPFWNSNYPSDPEVQQGLIGTSQQRKKCGYVNTENYPGGETKFGVAQKPNPRVDVTTMDYATAKKTGFNNYWKSAKMPCHNKAERVAIMLFDMNYLHGDGNARRIWEMAAITSNPSDSDAQQIAACEELYQARVKFIKSIPRPEFQKGWLKRATDCLSYVKSL